MIKPIEKPDWGYGYFIPKYTHEHINCSVNAQKDFKTWSDNQVEPINKLLSEGVVICLSDADNTWRTEETITGGNSYISKKALLIDIQPIKKESAEDVLRDIVEGKKYEGSWDTELVDRARRVLEDS